MNAKLAELQLVIRSSPKKAGVLGVLMVTLAVLGAKQLLGAKPGEASAKNAVEAVKDEVLGLSDIEAMIESGPTITVTLPGGQMRDLFRFDDRRFPPPVLERADPERSAKSDDPSDDPPPVVVDPEAQERDRIHSEAERFRLTSTLLGSQPLALIDLDEGRGRARSFMLRIGETIRGFTLVSVSHRQAVIEKDGHEITLHVDD
ncbi:MAG: hypothetical protein Tsb0013_02750 [Phycisphaerales bacterium]